MHNDNPTVHLQPAGPAPFGGQLTNPPPRPSRRRWVLAGIAAALAVAGITTAIALAAGGGDSEEPYRPIFDQDAIAEATAETEIETAVDRCVSNTRGVEVGDGGRSLNIVGAGRFDGPKIEDVACVLFSTGIPDSVVSRIDSTRALDGMQEASWDGYHAFWTYHPDDGLWMVIEQE